MSLPIDLEKAIADEKSKRGYGTEQDLAVLIEQAKTKDAPPPEDKKEDKPKEEKGNKAEADLATDLLGKRLGFTRKTKKETDEKKEEAGKLAAGVEDVTGVGVQDDKAKDKEEKPEVEKLDGGGGDTSKGAKKAKITKKPELDPIEIASAAAARTAQTFIESAESNRAKIPEPGPAKGAEEALSDEEKGELEVFREMAKAAPQFKELPRQYLGYLKKAEDYQRNWEKENPAKEFDPESDEHDGFFSKHQPKYSELEYKKAISRMVQRESGSKEVEQLTAKQKSLEAELAARELDPVINQTSIGALAEVIKVMNPEILKSIEKDGFQKYAEVNDVEADLIKEVASRMGPFIAGILQFDDPNGRIPFNKENPSHVEAVRYLREKEIEIGKKPWKDRMDDNGKIIVPRAEYFRMTETQKTQHSYLDTNMLIQLRVQEEAEKAQAQYEKELKKAESRAKRLGWSPPSSKENGHKAKEEEVEKEEKPEEKREETKSPEAGSASRIDTSGDVKNKAQKDTIDLTADILFQRR